MNILSRLTPLSLVMSAALAAFAPAAGAATSTTGSIDLPATADSNGSIGTFTVSAPVGSTFDVARYSGPDVLTGMSFAAQVSNVSMNFSGSVSFLGVAVPVTGGASVSVTATLGGTSVSGEPLLPFVRPGLSNSGPFNTPTGIVNPSSLGDFYSVGPSTFVAAGSVSATTTVNKIALGGGTLTGNPAAFTADVEYGYSTTPHADGGFGVGMLNALNLTFGPAAGAQNISIYNGAGVFDLDITGIGCAGLGCSYFSLPNTFANIVGGDFADGVISYLGGSAYPVSAVFTLTVGDSANPGLVGVGRNMNVETLQLNVTAVPEPTSWLMMLAGVAIVGTVVRRRRVRR